MRVRVLGQQIVSFKFVSVDGEFESLDGRDVNDVTLEFVGCPVLEAKVRALLIVKADIFV